MKAPNMLKLSNALMNTEKAYEKIESILVPVSYLATDGKILEGISNALFRAKNEMIVLSQKYGGRQ